MIKKIFTLIFIFSGMVQLSLAATTDINYFVVKENPFASEEIAVVATDSLGNIQENIRGIYNFTVNGFQEDLTFQNGTAFYRHKISKSTFMYVRHVNDSGSHSILYYLYKHDMKLSPFHISWTLLLIIPLALILAGYLFKRFIIIAVIVFIILLYFNHHNGLSIPTFFESIFDGLKHLFR